MKREKGLTFLGTAILVVLIALMVFGVVYYARMQVDKEKAEDIKTNLLLVKAKINKISSNYLLDKKEENLIGTKLSDMKEQDVIKEFLEKGLFDSEEKGKKYYVLNQENLNELELEKITLEEGSYYIVEYTEGEVYYTKGYTDENGNVHYNAKEQIEDKKQDENEEVENK